jgi:hypothetical protein
MYAALLMNEMCDNAWVHALVEKEGINDYRNDWVLSRRGQKRL